MLDAKQVISLLNLEPHPSEAGTFGRYIVRKRNSLQVLYRSDTPRGNAVHLHIDLLPVDAGNILRDAPVKIG
jgi:hypothetical protein